MKITVNVTFGEDEVSKVMEVLKLLRDRKPAEAEISAPEPKEGEDAPEGNGAEITPPEGFCEGDYAHYSDKSINGLEEIGRKVERIREKGGEASSLAPVALYHTRWSYDEIDKLQRLAEHGFGFDAISEAFAYRSDKGIRKQLWRMGYGVNGNSVYRLED